MIRWATLIAILVVAYYALTSQQAQSQPGLRGLLEKVKFVGRKVRLVALIYVAVLVISAVVRISGWSLD